MRRPGHLGGLDAQPRLAVGELGEKGGEVAFGGGHVGVVGVAQVDGQLGAVGHDVRQPGGDGDPPDRGAQLPVPARVHHLAHVHDDLSGGQTGVDAQLGRGGAGVRGATVQRHLLPRDRLHAGDDAHRVSLPQQHRALLDVALHVRVRRLQPNRPAALEADPLQLVTEPQPRGVGEAVRVVQAEPARGHRRTEHVGAEAHPLLLGERGDDDRAARRDVLLVQRTDDLERPEHAEAAVEGARRADAVDVRGGHDRREARVGAFPTAEDRAQLVDADLQARLLQPRDEQPPALGVGVGERLAVHPDQSRLRVVVGADRGELVQRPPQALAVDADLLLGTEDVRHEFPPDGR